MNRIGFVTVGHSEWNDTVYEVVEKWGGSEWAFVGYCAAIDCTLTSDIENRVVYIDSDESPEKVAEELKKFLKYEI